MAKSIKLNNELYLDSSSITHNRIPLNVLLNNRLYSRVLYRNAPASGNIANLSEPQSSYTIQGINFDDYDFLVITFASRVWGWCKKQEIIFNKGNFGSDSINTSNLFSTIMPLFDSNTMATMQYYFTNNNTITVRYNSHYTTDNHLFIQLITGYKVMNN